MEVWFYLKEEPRLRSQHTRRRTRKNLHPRSSEARQESFCPLDKDLSWKSAYRTSGFEIKHVDYFRVALDSGTTIK